LASSVLSLSLNFVGAAIIYSLGKKSQSPAVRAEAVHYSLEGVISTAIATAFLVTIIIKGTPYAAAEPYIDPAVTLIVSAIISVPSLKLMRQAFLNLLDSSIEEPSKMETVVRLAHHAEHYCNFKDIRTRNAGHKKFIEMKLIMPRDMQFARAHDIVSRIEKDIAGAVVNSEVSIAMVPCAKDCGLLKEKKPCPNL
jgi:cation diffusion facilitator family transporter